MHLNYVDFYRFVCYKMMSSVVCIQFVIEEIKMTTSLLQSKTFYCREWVFTKLLHCLDSRATAKTCGALVMGGPGSGKTAVCCELVWPTASSRAANLTQHMLAYYFCQAHDAETLSVTNFLHCLADQVSCLRATCYVVRIKIVPVPQNLHRCTVTVYFWL